MSARYTSPDLSRRLRDAGLEQRVVPGSDLTRYWRGDQLSDSEAIACGWDRIARALRLDEVLEELTREREGGPLAKRWELRSSEGPPGAQPYYCSALTGIDLHTFLHVVPQRIAEATAYGATEAEAAGLVLLQLLEERRG